MAKFCAELHWSEEKQQEHLLHFCPSTFPHDGIPKSVEDYIYGLCGAHTIAYANFDVMMQSW